MATFLKDSSGASVWAVGLKTTFAFRSEQPCLFVPDQVAPHQGPVFANDDPESDLIADTDVSLPKPKVDILVDAKAYPPHGNEHHSSFLAQIQAGSLIKNIEVAPPLRLSGWKGVIADPELEQTPVPLRYSQSYGGDRTEANPIGLGDDPYIESGTSRLPRLSVPGQPLIDAGSAVPPCALNAIPRSWSSRRVLGGTYDTAWQRRRSPLLPEDLQPAYWQAAPGDQQIDRAEADGAQIKLTHMTSSDGQWSDPPITFALPKMQFDVTTRFRGKWCPMDLELQTIHIYADARRVSLFFLALLPIEASQNDVLVDTTKISLEPGAEFRVKPEHASLFNGMAREEETA